MSINIVDLHFVPDLMSPTCRLEIEVSQNDTAKLGP